MRLNADRRLFAGLLTAGVGIALLAGCGSGQDHSSMPGMSSSASSSSSPSSSAAAGDVTFAQMMIPHHEQAIEMAELALQERAKASPQVTRLATDISRAQGPEIETMKQWLAAWGAPTGMPMDHSMPGKMGESEMTTLETASGEDFDRAWLTAMIAHHEGAVTMAQDVLGTTSNAEVTALAHAIVDGQEKEIATMKGLLG